MKVIRIENSRRWTDPVAGDHECTHVELSEEVRCSANLSARVFYIDHMGENALLHAETMAFPCDSHGRVLDWGGVAVSNAETYRQGLEDCIAQLLKLGDE